MRERPILFSGRLVRAILEGRKTQTRRLVQSPARNMQREGMRVIQHRAPGDPWYRDCVWSMRNRMGVWGDYTDEQFLALCPFGQAGDRLWVRETWAEICEAGDAECHCLASRPWPAFADKHRIAYRADDTTREGPWRPSIFLPRIASRLSLEVTGVRVERLQDIDGDDILAEGFRVEGAPIIRGARVHSTEKLREGFAAGWDSINGKRKGASWAANPWVWVVEFKRLEEVARG